MKTIVRTHDLLYLAEDRYSAPKQIHLELIQLIRHYLNAIDADQEARIGDFGCAAGEFVHALNQSFSAANGKYENTRIEGYDVLEALIEKARKRVPGLNFHIGSVEDQKICAESHLNVTVMTGVLCIFDSFEPILENAIFWTKNKGRILVHSLFNDYPVDVNVKYNLACDYGQGVLESGWNIFSKESISQWATQNENVESFRFHDFQIETDIPRNTDPVRSWTFRDIDGRRLTTNGLSLLLPSSTLEINVVKPA